MGGGCCTHYVANLNGRPRPRREDNIEVDVKEMLFDRFRWVGLAPYRGKWLL